MGVAFENGNDANAGEVTVLLLPGLYDSGPGHWQTLWEAQRPWAGATVQRVQQADWAAPRCADWVRTLSDVMSRVASDVVLVAHSSACAMVAHWARDAASHQCSRVRGALLVGPSDPTAPVYPEGPSGFGPVPMARLPFRSVVVASRTDEYVTLAQATRYAEAWGSELVDAGDAGHLNATAGYGAWPAGQRLVAELIVPTRD